MGAENNQNELEEMDTLVLEFDDGEIECEIMGVFEAKNGKEYIALVPMDESDDIYLYAYKEVGEEEFEIVDIEDDAEFELVLESFHEIMDEIEE